MLRSFSVVAVLLVVAGLHGWLRADDAGDDAGEALDNWPQFRGPLGTGEAPRATPPLEWSEDKNVKWKTPLPGLGHSSPVVWGQRVFVTAAVPIGEKLEPRYTDAPGAHDNLPVTQRHKFVVLAIDRASGKIVWENVVHEALPRDQGHFTASLASASPVTDGEHLFAHFGSYGLYCLDFEGNVVWQKMLGEMWTKHGHGEGASPALYGNVIAINWDHEGDSFIVALDKNTGKELWKVAREEDTSWCTPIIVDLSVTRSVSEGPSSIDESIQLIVPGTNRLRGYDLTTGKVLWECGGLSSNIVATPVAADGMLFAGSSYEKRALLAIHLDGAAGDITETRHVAWLRSRGTPYVPSPLYHEGVLYFLTHYQNVMTGVNGLTGEDQPGAFRLPGLRDIYSSPIAAGGHIYVTDRDGGTLVFRPVDTPEPLAVNRLNDTFSATAAAAGKEIFLRGERFLYSVAEE